MATVALAWSSCTTKPSTTAGTAREFISPKEQLERGEYLVTISGCNDCHSPKIMTSQGPVLDSARLLSGRPEKEPVPYFNPDHLRPGHGVYMTDDLTAAAGPWGISFPRNLTPDTTTGIGAWPEEMFIKVLRSGKHMGADAARPILPPMPWMNYALMKDEDLKAVYAYLQSLPPVKNLVPESVPPDEAMSYLQNLSKKTGGI